MAIAGIAVVTLAVAILQSSSGTPVATGSASPAATAAAVPSILGTPPAASLGATPQPAPASPAATINATPTTAPTATATPRPATEVLVGAGDIADCDSNLDTQTAELVDGIAGTVFTLGDNVYEDGTRAEFENCYDPTWGRFRSRTHPAPGNHDYQTAGAGGYFGYFGDLAGPSGRGYYAYTRGAWRIYSLNSECGEIGGCGTGSAQLQWLRNDLAANPSRCSLAYWHHPRYSSGEHGNQAFMDPIWDELYRAGVEIVLAGHDHSYERFAAMNASGNLAPLKGITSFVVGTGGRHFYEFDTILSASRARVTGVAGVLRLRLAPDGWSSRFIAIPGETYTDVADGTCH